MTSRYLKIITIAVVGFCSTLALTSAPHANSANQAAACEGYGPQSPRDIDQLEGNNKRVFAMPPDTAEMNLCNIHFHNNAEHKAKDFSIEAAGTEDGKGGGFQCAVSKSLSRAELKPLKNPVCGDLQPGETVEVHWVYSSCKVKPGAGLGSCLSSNCANPDLRVETQVFTVVNDSNATDFNTLDYAGSANNDGFHQTKNTLPKHTGLPVEFLGSTTGPKYSEQKCSPLQVGWSVRPQCAKVDIKTLGKWCENNSFAESKAHGVRKLVRNPALLSNIK